jgi:predicted ATP-grasp superfamily ATP-dependent carboligase
MATESLLIFGASARAAAFSALRAGLEPWCADLFGDEDLRAKAPSLRVPAGAYPQAFLDLVCRELPGPWMFTGGLENHRLLVQEMARRRPLWGNGADALAACRSPHRVAALLAKAGLPYPALLPADRAPPEGRWLFKPSSGAGGAGIRAAGKRRGRGYLQEFIEGQSCAALYVGDGKQARWLGTTRQLVGENWLHAAPFHYCGSIGPLLQGPPLRQAFERLGQVLAAGCGLRGLFGIDCVLRDGVPWPVEINPRYTASVEVLEHAGGTAALTPHRRAFETGAQGPAPEPKDPADQFVGKAILFARAPLVFPGEGPWRESVGRPGVPDELPAFADIPRAGEMIRKGRPILTFFARAVSPGACLDLLMQTARDLDHRLFHQ